MMSLWVKRALGILAFIMGLVGVFAFSARAHGEDLIVRDGLTGQIVNPVQVARDRSDMTVSATGYLPRRVSSMSQEPLTVWPTDDWDYEFNVVYGKRFDSYLARPRDGVYGISLPSEFANKIEYRNHLASVIAEVARITRGHVTLIEVSEQVADVRLRVDFNHEGFRDSNGRIQYAALAYVWQDRGHYNTQAELVFLWPYMLTDDDLGSTLLHEVGHWLGFWHSKGKDVMAPYADGTHVRQYSPQLTATLRMMHQRIPGNRFPDDGRIIGFAHPKSRNDFTMFVCPR